MDRQSGDKIAVNFGNLLDGIEMPKMYRVHQKFPEEKIEEIEKTVRDEMESKFGAASLAGKKIAVTAGSRGISHCAGILQEIIKFFKDKGAEPFVIPSMGSHGGGTVEGQMEVLRHLGLTPESLGAEFAAEMDTVAAGHLSNGLPLYFSKAAMEADGIFLVNKIKPHADFKGEHESGLVKMLVIGLGKHKGCASLHKLGFENFPWALPEAAEIILKQAPVLGGLAIVDNAYDEPMVLEAVLPERLLERDRELLKLAKANMPCLKAREVDVLIIEEIGKNISGEGMDPNVTGRPGSGLNVGFTDIRIKNIVVLGTTGKSGGNGAGLGMADITTLDCVRNLDLGIMYTNSITAGILGPSRLPIILNNDREAIRTAIKIAAPLHTDSPRIIWIKNTLELDEIRVSEALLDEFERREDAGIEGRAETAFDENGRLMRI
ncbi:lactate racemase domain-containing protein [Clostridium transplantifaecale]|uniref:lactate racemase domain-containing protein n=1 Tax=Clostridium transplantifaecale TaxID=2479838 RepID=UPI000F6311DB|nr:lactate racemase domain-containing protein [Clostridium transplantifaecale]